MKKVLAVTISACDMQGHSFAAMGQDGRRQPMQTGFNAQVYIDGAPTWEGHVSPEAVEEFVDGVHVLCGSGMPQTKLSDEEAPFTWLHDVKEGLTASFSKQLKDGLNRIDQARQNLKQMGRDV